MNDKNIDDFSCLFLKILSGYVIVKKNTTLFLFESNFNIDLEFFFS